MTTNGPFLAAQVLCKQLSVQIRIRLCVFQLDERFVSCYCRDRRDPLGKSALMMTSWEVVYDDDFLGNRQWSLPVYIVDCICLSDWFCWLSAHIYAHFLFFPGDIYPSPVPKKQIIEGIFNKVDIGTSVTPSNLFIHLPGCLRFQHDPVKRVMTSSMNQTHVAQTWHWLIIFGGDHF